MRLPFSGLLSRRSFLTLIGAAAIAATGCGPAPAAELPPRERFHLFLLVGQSNMAGRGKVQAQDKKPHPRVLTFSKGREWVPAVDPIHFDKSSVGVGLGRTFAIELAEANPDITIGLIPCAVGGSPIESWEPGALDTATKTHPWDDAMARCELALPAGTLKGILWHQGESDANAARAPLYEKRLHSLIDRFRTTLKAPDVPFIAGQMGQFAGKPWSDEMKRVDAIHRALPKAMENTAFVSAEGLKDKGDLIHFDAESYRELGRRYAAAYRKLNEAARK